MRVDEREVVDKVNAEQWDSTLGLHSFYASFGWLEVAERTADIPPFYLATETEPTATLPCYPLSMESPFPFCRIEFLARRFVPVCADGDGAELAARLMPTLFLGGRNPAHTGFGTALLDTPAERETAAHVLAGYAERAAAERGLNSVGMLYVDEDDEVARRVLAERGYASFSHHEASVLKVTGDDLEDYIRSRGRYGTKVVRQEIKRLDRAGVRFEMRPFGPELRDEVDRLEVNLNRKYGGTFDDDAVRRLREMIGDLLGERVLIGLALVGDRAAGSVLVLRWRDELYARTAGFDYELTDGLPVYFGLVFYNLIEYGQRTGVRAIHYATGTEDAKRRRGCRMVRQHAYVKGLDRELHKDFQAAVMAGW